MRITYPNLHFQKAKMPQAGQVGGSVEQHRGDLGRRPAATACPLSVSIEVQEPRPCESGAAAISRIVLAMLCLTLELEIVV